MKILYIRIILICISAFLITTAYFVTEWSKEFVDPCCSGLCGRCPPSVWECYFMNSVATFQIIIAMVLAIIGLFVRIDKEETINS